MRSLRPTLLPLILAACAPGAPAGPAPGTFAGVGKDRLCIAGDAGALRGGVVTYAADGRANCTMAGALSSAGDKLTLVPKGEGTCRVEFGLTGDSARIVGVPASCAFYCAPGATLANKEFKRAAGASPAVDFAGDLQC